MDFEREYQQKLRTPEQAAKVIKSGDLVDYGWAVTTPEKIDAVLAKRVGELDAFANLKRRLNSNSH